MASPNKDLVELQLADAEEARAHAERMQAAQFKHEKQMEGVRHKNMLSQDAARSDQKKSIQNEKFAHQDRHLQTVHKHKMEQMKECGRIAQEMATAQNNHQFRMLEATNTNQQKLADKAADAAKHMATCHVIGQGLGALGQFGSAMALKNTPMGGMAMGGNTPGLGGMPQMPALGNVGSGAGFGSMPQMPALGNVGSGGGTGMLPFAMGAAGGAGMMNLFSSAPKNTLALSDNPNTASTPPRRTSLHTLEDNAGVAQSATTARKLEGAKKRGQARLEELRQKKRRKSAASSSSTPMAEPVRPCFIEEVDDDAEPGIQPVDESDDDDA